MEDPINLSLGAGVFYFDRFEGGVRTGERDLGNVSGAEFTSSVETIEKNSSRTAERRLLRKAVTKQAASLSITVDYLTSQNLSLFSQGEVRTLAQSAATVTGEALTAKVKKGRHFPTAKRQISAVVVKQGAVTLVAGTDYMVDARTGRIYFVPGGAAVEDTAATVDYAAALVNLETVVGNVSGIIEGSLRFIGDPSAGPILEVEFYKVCIEPNGSIPLIQENEWGGFQLNVTVLDNSAVTPNEPYYRILRHGAR
jgi:hypothetical protein